MSKINIKTERGQYNLITVPYRRNCLEFIDNLGLSLQEKGIELWTRVEEHPGDEQDGTFITLSVKNSYRIKALQILKYIL